MQPDLTQLPTFLQTRRWFAGKAWPIKNVSLVDHAHLTAEGSPYTLAVVEVVYALGSPERYFLPIAAGEQGQMDDALAQEALARRLIQLIGEGGELPTSSGALLGQRLEGSEPAWARLSPRPAVRALGAEQSNTSVVFDETVILKLFRKIEPGVSPELEMGRFLAQKRFPGTPPLLGWLEWTGPAAATVGVAHRHVQGARDGWEYLLEAFRSSPQLSEELLAQIRALGTRVGELHNTLASDSRTPAFAPEPVGSEELQRWSSSILGELGVSLAEASAVAPELASRRAEIGERARALAHLRPSGQKIRVHGDLHLGQVLRAGEEWLIFDFEGEVGRSHTQRREKHTPLKDVAGMLRSFAYAEAAAELAGATASGRDQAAREAFLNGYWQATAGASFLPADGDTLKAILEALELEKALYEVRYELRHRPEWVNIPLRALREAAG